MSISKGIKFWRDLVVRDMKDVITMVERDGFTSHTESHIRLLTDSLNKLEGIDHYFRVNDMDRNNEE